ncbi:inner centromere protein [Frankliniella occidentalis]|uniref:Inner centromere protein n=1 Tax=Frankliniella occidentalis TaxID=133901 RepID=A0A6J1RZ17_FRAOC|nr:inner centromere protein [Frankliniella occidentalis]
MVFTWGDLEKCLGDIRDQGRVARESYDQEFDLHHDHLNAALEEVKNGTAQRRGPLVSKTPGKKKAPLTTVSENAPSTSILDDEQLIECSSEVKVVKRGRGRPKKVPSVSYNKRISEDQIESTSKRICATSTISTDSGLSTGSQNMCNNSTISVTVKEEAPTPGNTDLELKVASVDKAGLTTVVSTTPKSYSERSSSVPGRKSSQKLRTWVVKNEPQSAQSSMYGTPTDQDSAQLEIKAQIDDGSQILPAQTKRSNVPSTGQPNTPSISPVAKTPTRVYSSAKPCSLVKAPEEEIISSKGEDSFSNTPVSQQVTLNNITMNDTSYLHDQDKVMKTPLTSSIFLKPFASASRIPQLFMNAASPFVNRFIPLTPSFQRSNSFTASGSTNIISTVQSFLPKPALDHEVNRSTSRKEDIQNLAAKAEAARKKKEEIMRARMEEKTRIREEKRLKVIAQREAKEKERLENQKKIEEIKEARQKQIQAEREEKIKQENLKKKQLAERKAAENEERRRQEEEAKLAKLKQQEEELEQAAAARRREQEEALQKRKERQQQEHEASVLRAKEAEARAKQAHLKSQLEQASVPQSLAKKKPHSKSKANNYCIDDAGTDDSSEDEAKPKKAIPLWAQSKQRLPKLLEDHNISQSQIFMFFGTRKSTPDLGKIFLDIDRRRLLRKSSAVWRTPPKENS